MEQSHSVIVKFEGRDAQRGILTFEDSMRKAGRTGAGFEAAMLKASLVAGAAFVAIGAAAAKMALEINSGMANVATLIPGNIKRVQELKAAVQDMAVATGKSTSDLVGGLYQTVSAFGDTADTAKILEINARAAAGGLAQTTEAINLTSLVTKNYGDTSAAAVEKVADLALMTVRLGQTTFPELAASMGRVVPLAKEVGQSQEDMFAVFATATGVVGTAAEVATQYRGIINALMKPTADLSKLIEQQGFASGEAMLRSMGLADTLELIGNTAKTTGKPITEYIAQIEAVPLALALAGPQADTFRAKLAEMGRAAGTTNVAFEEHANGIDKAGFAWRQLKTELVVAGQRIGDTLLPPLMSATGALRPFWEAGLKAVEWFGKLPQPIQATTVAILALTVAAVPAAAAMRALAASNFVATISSLANSIPILTARVWLLNTAIRATLASLGLFAAIATTVAAAVNFLINAHKRLNDEFIAGVTSVNKYAKSIVDLRAQIASGRGVEQSMIDNAKATIKLIDEEREKNRELLNARKLEGAEALARENQLVAIRDQLTLLIVEGEKHVRVLTDETDATRTNTGVVRDAEEQQKRLLALLNDSIQRRLWRRDQIDHLTRGLDEFAAASKRAAEAFSDSLNRRIVQGIDFIPVPGRPGPQRLKSDQELEREAADLARANEDAARQTAEAWFRAAQIMGDAIGGAFGEMGDKVSQFVNQVIQVIALMQQFSEIARAMNAGGGGGGGFLSNLLGMFGGGGGGGTQFNNSAAGNYFSSFFGGGKGGAKGGGTFSGGGFGGALMGAGIGSGIGGLGSMLGLGGYAQEGGAIGGAIGGGLGGFVGAAIGGAIGTIAGSLIKKGADEALGMINAAGGFDLTKAEGEAGKALQQVGAAIAAGLSQFNALVGGQISKFGVPGLKFREGEGFSVFGGGAAFRTEDAGEAAAEAMLRAIRNADLSQVSDAIRTAILSPLSDSMEALEANVRVALALDNLGVPQFKSGLQEAIGALRELGEAGRRLGLDTSKVGPEMLRTFNDARNQILGVERDEQAERLEQAQQFNEVLAAERQKAEQELAALRDQLAATAGVELPEILSGLGPHLDELGGALTRFSGEGLTPVTAEVAARIAELEALLLSLASLDIDPAAVLAQFEDPAREAERQRRQDEKQRKQEERARELAAALDTVGGSMKALRDQHAEYAEAVKVLADRHRTGALSAEDYARAISEFVREAELAFGNRLAGVLDRYYGSVEDHEQFKMQLAQANFDLEIAMLKAEFILLQGLNLLSQEALANFQSVLDWIDANAPSFDDFQAPAFDPLTPAELFLQRLADAANDPAFSAQRGVLGLLQQLYSFLPDTAMVSGVPQFVGFREVTRPVGPSGQVGDRSIDRASQEFETILVPIFDLLDQEMTVAEARFNLAKQMQLLDLEVIRAQLLVAGVFTGPVKDLWDQVQATVAGSTFAPPALQDNTRAVQDNTSALREASMSFNQMWNTLVHGEGGGADDPVAQLAAQFAELRGKFLSQSTGAQASFLQGQGVQGLELLSTTLGLQWFYNGQPFSSFIAQQLYDNLVRPIENLKLDELFKTLEDQRLRPIRDFFDTLRTSGATLTRTQRYEATYQSFLDAAAAGNIGQAASLGSSLLQDIGLQQFGGASQAYRDLYAEVVSLLGGFLPEGPPADLMGQQLAAQSRAADTLDRLYEREHQDSERVVAAIDRNTRAVENLASRESGARR